MPAKGQGHPMAHSVFLARLIGPVALVMAIGLFMNTTGYRSIAEEFLRSRALIYLSGLLMITAGLAIILTHNVWVANWPVLITVLGWLATIGGAARIVFPDKIESFGRAMLQKPLALTISGAIWSVLGALFCFFGYLR
jgi:uncharacterized membrane protein